MPVDWAVAGMSTGGNITQSNDVDDAVGCLHVGSGDVGVAGDTYGTAVERELDFIAVEGGGEHVVKAVEGTVPSTVTRRMEVSRASSSAVSNSARSIPASANA